MSCGDCERKQKLAFDKNIDQTTPIAYVRIGYADVAIVGCERHIKEAVDAILEYKGNKEVKS